MPDVSIIDGVLQLCLSVRERVLSLVDDELAIPLRAITRAVVVPDIMTEVRGSRTGAQIPGLLAIGTWSGVSGGRTYTDLVVVHRPGSGIVFTLSGQRWGRLVIGRENPEQFLDDLGLPAESAR